MCGGGLHCAGRFATSLQCSRFAGSRRTRCAQTAASPDPQNAARFGGPEAASDAHRIPGLRC
ncbi:MAG: hypothetical protein EOP80_17095 [Variovorax sp.]|nr:MAG: hypothetical protein EOP80_17095 [Variovorax sp.]